MRASVIIPCRNGEGIVAEAVRSAFSQAEPPLEVIVVDDASTDRTSDAARAAGARVLRTDQRRNAGGARNIGIEASSGDVLAFLDADVVAPADWLARVRAAFGNDPQVVAVGGSVVNGRPGVWGDLDLLVNNAGLAPPMGPLPDVEWDKIQTVLDTNMTGLVALTRALLPTLIERKGAVINLSSVAAPRSRGSSRRSASPTAERPSARCALSRRTSARTPPSARRSSRAAAGSGTTRRSS